MPPSAEVQAQVVVPISPMFYHPVTDSPLGTSDQLTIQAGTVGVGQGVASHQPPQPTPPMGI